MIVSRRLACVSGQIGLARFPGSDRLLGIGQGIDFGFAEAKTTYGVIGVKVWIYRGDIYEQRRRREPGITTGAF